MKLLGTHMALEFKVVNVFRPPILLQMLQIYMRFEDRLGLEGVSTFLTTKWSHIRMSCHVILEHLPRCKLLFTHFARQIVVFLIGVNCD